MKPNTRNLLEYKGIIPNTINKVVYLGDISINQKRTKIHCVIKYQDKKLSISGVVGAKANGNADGACGQIYDEILNNLETFKFSPEWDKIKAFQFVEYWKEWHLNDLTAGTPRQEAFIKEWKKNHDYDYGKACEALKKIGLYKDSEANHYIYGSSWLFREVPEKVLNFLNNLPEASKPCKWDLLT